MHALMRVHQEFIGGLIPGNPRKQQLQHLVDPRERIVELVEYMPELLPIQGIGGRSRFRAERGAVGIAGGCHAVYFHGGGSTPREGCWTLRGCL